MPCAKSAACSAFMAPPGKSAKTVASLALIGSLPMAMPPSLSRSFCSRPWALPVPITTRRSALRPSGTASSSVEPLLPVKRSALAARATRPEAGAIALAVAEPNLRASSQNTTKTPLAGGAKGENPSFKASDIGTILILGTSAVPCPYGPRLPLCKGPNRPISRVFGWAGRRRREKAGFGPASRGRPLLESAFEGTHRGLRFLLFVVHVQRLCLCAATLSTEQGKPDGGGIRRVMFGGRQRSRASANARRKWGRRAGWGRSTDISSAPRLVHFWSF